MKNEQILLEKSFGFREIVIENQMQNNKNLYFDEIEKELVINSKAGDTDSANKLIKRYEPLSNKISGQVINKFPNIPIEKDDLHNELRVEIFRLISKYDENRGVTFGSFIYGFLINRAINYCRHFTTLNHQVINYSSNIENESEFGLDEYEMESLNNIIKDEILAFEGLTVKEREVLREYLSEKTMEETIIKLNISKSSYYRYLNLSKEKIKKIYSLINI